MKNPYQQIGRKIRIIRKLAGFTQSQLAERTGLSDNYIGLIERGEGHPTLETVGKIAEILNVKIGEFFAGSEEESKNLAQILKEFEHLLKQRNLKDAQLLLSIGKKVFESFPHITKQ